MKLENTFKSVKSRRPCLVEAALATVHLGGQELCGAGERHGCLRREGKAQARSGEHTVPGVSASVEGTETVRVVPRQQFMS